jgi:hypothetical protein
MTCILCTIQTFLINAATSEHVATLLIRLSKFYKYAAYLV